MPQRPYQISICGTFDVENYGDLLFPLIAQKELSDRLGDVRLHRFSYHHKSEPEWPFEVTSLVDFPRMFGELDGVLIGGGHILRFDKLIAPDYFPPSPQIHHPTGYWLSPILAAVTNGIPVAWNAPGMLGRAPAWADQLMELAVRNSNYVSVRDRESKQTLERYAGETLVRIVPDTAFGISRLLSDLPSRDYETLCRERGLTRPYIVVQATAPLLPFYRFALSHPSLFRGFQILLLASGPIHGDDVALFDEPPANVIQMQRPPHPLLLAELIRGARFVVADSLHVSISALALGVPLFRPVDRFVGKYAPLKNFDGVFTYGKWRMKPEQFLSALQSPRASRQLPAMQEQLKQHWDTIATVFSTNSARTVIAPSSVEFWQRMPSILEPAAPRWSRLRGAARWRPSFARVHSMASLLRARI
jgi:Polysaccharide pyruvyl transferase